MKTRGRAVRAWLARALALGLGFASASPSALAAREGSPSSDASRGAIESCISHDTLRIEADEHAVLLDDTDRDRLIESMRQLYPLLERDGFAPSKIILWYPRDGGSVYVALMQNPQRPADLCFTALLDARRFAMTPVLKRANFLASPLD